MSLRHHREQAGLTQADLARRAGVSRQLVGAAEAGRNLPRVDAALALARVLAVDVSTLFATADLPIDALSGEAPGEGSLVRSGVVGDRVVTATARTGADGWDVADAVVRDGGLKKLAHHRPGLVVAGCEPGLQLLERLLREGGMGAVAASASSAAAEAALVAGRLHAAVVHGPQPAPAREVDEVARFGLATWRVGLAAPADSATGWWRGVLAGTTPVIQREAGAGVQRTFEEALDARSPKVVPGPRVGSHLDAARRSVLTGMPAVTIEPAALAVGAAFHPLDVHVAQLLVGRLWLGEKAVMEAVVILTGRRFQQRLEAIGGYDLVGCGDRVA
jgi:DNA-binding XRE family transcriptional regulator